MDDILVIPLVTKPTLTEEQQSIYTRISPKGYQCIDGRAGTGKTTVMASWILAHARKYRIAVCAPTNKAVSVIRKKTGNCGAQFMTVHSLLALREQITPDGKLVFKRSPNAKSRAEEFDIIICDECSMVNQQLYDLIMEEVPNCLFVGDFNQIPPVGEDISPTSLVPRLTLDTIMRQAEGSGIISCSLIGDTFTKSDGVYPLAEDAFRDHALRVFSKEESSDLDFAKIVAWTNDEVGKWNNIVRDHVLNSPETKIVIGDRLIAMRPVYMNDEVVYSTNDEFTVESVEVKQENLGSENSPLVFNYYSVKTKYIDYSGYVFYRYINVIHESSERLYNDTLESLRSIAMKCHQSYKTLAWREFYKFQEWYAKVGYCWAITAHKSQGSTYRNCFLIAKDIRKNRNYPERTKIMYTAMTRASTNLFILN